MIAAVTACVLTACATPGPEGSAQATTGSSGPSSATVDERADSPPERERETNRARSERVGAAASGGRELGRFDNGRAMHHVRVLAGKIGVRVRATRGERRGISYVADKLRAYGYRVRVQKYKVDGGTSHNVVARWPGGYSHPMVVGGHVDTVRSSPGANDNASGIAVLLENARLFAGTRQARWLRFVGFGSEEYGSNGLHHVGSSVYVKRLNARQIRRLPGMVSVDMVADGWPLITGTAGIGPPRVARTLYRILDKTKIAVDYQTTCDCSDNGPFERAGIPAAFVWSGFEPNYHDDSDRVRNMRRKHLRRSGRAVRLFLKKIDRDMIRFFRNS